MSEQIHQLIVRRGPKQGHVYELLLPIVNVGRDPMSDINLNDPEVSRQHARLIRLANGYQIQDLNSTNGTYLNGKKLENDPVDLQPGQEVMMGSGVVLFYQVIVEETPLPEPLPTPEPEAEIETEGEPDGPETLGSPFKLPQTSHPLPPSEPEKTPPLPDLRYRAATEASRRPVADPPPPRQPAPPPVAMPDESNNRRRTMIAILVASLLICGCCAFLVFMYQWGGDWILRQMELIP